MDNSLIIKIDLIEYKKTFQDFIFQFLLALSIISLVFGIVSISTNFFNQNLAYISLIMPTIISVLIFFINTIFPFNKSYNNHIENILNKNGYVIEDNCDNPGIKLLSFSESLIISNEKTQHLYEGKENNQNQMELIPLNLKKVV